MIPHATYIPLNKSLYKYASLDQFATHNINTEICNLKSE